MYSAANNSSSSRQSLSTPTNGDSASSKVVVITTGGTIACTTNKDGSLTPSISGEALVQPVRERFPDGNMLLDVVDLGAVDSANISFAKVDEIVLAVRDALADPTVSGVVVTHGTDSMEETAMAVDVFHGDPRPVIFTGAQLPFDHPDSDGLGNLFEAVVIATDRSAQGIGALIVFGHAVLPVRGACKWHTSDALAFATNAPEEPLRPEPLQLHPLAEINVPIIAAFQGSDASLIDAALSHGAQGLVIEGMGSGNVPDQLAEGIERAITSGIPVVMTSRVPRGDVFAAYGGRGGGATLAREGVIYAGCIHAPQARVILSAAIAAGVHPQTLF